VKQGGKGNTERDGQQTVAKRDKAGNSSPRTDEKERGKEGDKSNCGKITIKRQKTGCLGRRSDLNPQVVWRTSPQRKKKET